jgi:ribonuclease HI
VLSVFVDGGGNKLGNCYYGIAWFRGDDLLFRYGDKLPKCRTNNEAEYEAIIAAIAITRLHVADLTQAIGKNVDEEITFFMDSELIVKQMLGEYQVNAINLAEKYEDARRYLQALRELNAPYRVWLRHIPREQNEIADQTGREALGR